ncbi:MAG: ATP-binding cassette domain-containing protein [Acetobacteraceae bacterium]
MTEALRTDGVIKRFGQVTALNGVSMHVALGETLGVLGDNGAGKSTLMKILAGFHQPDAGGVFVDDKPVRLGSVDEARALGIECVYQDLALVNGLAIYHNLFLNREILRPGPFRLLNHPEMRRQAAAALAEIGIQVASVDLEVGRLSGGQRQAIAVARAVVSNARILLLDEPLAAMGAREAGLIIGLIERLRARRHRHRDDRAQLRADAGNLRPGDPDAARRGNVRERRHGDVAGGAAGDRAAGVPGGAGGVIVSVLVESRTPSRKDGPAGASLAKKSSTAARLRRLRRTRAILLASATAASGSQ